MELGFWTRKWGFLPRLALPILVVRKFFSTMEREKKHMLSEIVKVKGLMPLLMKPRNGQNWTDQDKIELMDHLKRLSDLSPYFAASFLPGGFFMLPVLAWWLDRRRIQRAAAGVAVIDAHLRRSESHLF
jgi:hypothetical protein